MGLIFGTKLSRAQAQIWLIWITFQNLPSNIKVWRDILILDLISLSSNMNYYLKYQQVIKTQKLPDYFVLSWRIIHLIPLLNATWLLTPVANICALCYKSNSWQSPTCSYSLANLYSLFTQYLKLINYEVPVSLKVD